MKVSDLRGILLYADGNKEAEFISDDGEVQNITSVSIDKNGTATIYITIYIVPKTITED